MCKCRQTIQWQVVAELDEDSMAMGYDGDLEPGTDTSGWVAYQLISYAECSRCGAREDRDALGGCWVSEGPAEGYLSDTAKFYGMVPKGADFELSIQW